MQFHTWKYEFIFLCPTQQKLAYVLVFYMLLCILYIYIHVNQSILWLHFSDRLRQLHNLYIKCKFTLLRFSISLLVLLSNGQVEDCHYLPANDIWVPLIQVSKVLSAIQPLLAASQYCPWTLCFPFLHYYLTHMCEQPGVIKCLEACGAKVQYWHRKTSCIGGDICSVIQACQLKPLVLNNLCPLARIHPTCQQAPWHLNRQGSTQPGKQYI